MIRQLNGPCMMPPVRVMAGKMNFSPSSTYLFTSNSSHAHFKLLALKTRAVEQVIKSGFITCEIYITLCLKISMRCHWPVLKFRLSIDLLYLLVVYPSIAINSNHT